MTTTLADLLAGVDMEGGENFCDSVYNFLKNQGKDINLLTNSGFGVWSQSDANKGIGYLDFDVGSVIAPVVGELITSASGAVGKVIWLDITGGTFAGNNAVGTIYLGACSTLCFNNNEAVTWPGGGNATVNQPDGAVGTDGLVKNGAFVDNIDPPNDWTANLATLTTEVGGQVGNCMMVANSGAASGYAWQVFATEIGKIYKISIYFKKGTSGSANISLDKDGHGGNDIWEVDVSDVAWTLYTHVFEATTTTTYLTLLNLSLVMGRTSYWDEITLYEITPCCTAADTVAMDGWYKDATCDIYRQHWDATYSKCGSFYSLKIVPTVADDYVRFPGAFYDNEEWYKQFCGRTVTIRADVYASLASHAKLVIQQTSGDTSSAYHSGTPGWESLEVTIAIATDTAFFDIQLFCDATPNVDGTSIVYVSQDIMVFGSSIGEGMYQPRLQEFIWLEKNIPSNTYDGLLDQSDLAYKDLNLEADSDAMLPKGARVIAVLTDIEDAGSGAGLDVHLELRKDAIADTFFINSVAGKPNDIHNHQSGLQPCDVNGDVDIHLDASAANTLDINKFEYHGVQVN